MDVKQKLLDLKIRTDPEIVREVVLRLNKGQALFSMYTSDPPKLAKSTAVILRKKFKEGLLGFVLQEIESVETIDLAYPFTRESHEEREKRVTAKEGEDFQEIEEALRIKPPIGFLKDRDGLGVHRMRVIDELPSISWSIKGLEDANIPKDKALILLSEYDGLHLKRVSAEISEYGDGYKRWLQDFRGVDRYVALHYLVGFCADYKDAPFDVLEKAAILKSKGLLELDMRLRAAGEDIVRYEVWRLEPEYMKAYLTAIKRYYGTKRQQEKWETELRVLLDKASVKEVVG